MGRRLYFVFCISLEVEEDEEKTHETTGIGVIEGAVVIVTNILLYSASSTLWFSLIIEIPKERNMERSRDVGDAGRCLKQPRRGAMVPRRIDLLVNQSKIDGASPKKELLSQSQKKEDI